MGRISEKVGSWMFFQFKFVGYTLFYDDYTSVFIDFFNYSTDYLWNKQCLYMKEVKVQHSVFLFHADSRGIWKAAQHIYLMIKLQYEDLLQDAITKVRTAHSVQRKQLGDHLARDTALSISMHPADKHTHTSILSNTHTHTHRRTHTYLRRRTYPWAQAHTHSSTPPRALSILPPLSRLRCSRSPSNTNNNNANVIPDRKSVV